MEKEVVSYVKHHSFQVIVVVVGVFIILAIGEFVLYRKTQELNQMISEGVMQIKEEVQTKELSLSPEISDNIFKKIIKWLLNLF